MKRHILSVIFYVLLARPFAFASELPPAVVKATSNFEESLRDLKISVEQLNASNAQLEAKNEQLKGQITPLRLQLGKFGMEHQALEQSVSRLKENSEVGDKQLAKAKQELSMFDDKMDNVAGEIKRIADGIASKEKEEAALSQQLEALSPVINIAPPAVNQAEPKPDSRKEKLKMMKMILESKQRQEYLQGSLASLQKGSATQGITVLVARKAFLEDNIKALEQEQAKTPAVSVKAVEEGALDDNQQAQMELQLKVLQKNHEELEILVAQIQRKILLGKAAPQERLEQNKLELNIDELKREGCSLKADLEALRVQMVELDKRKTRLEDLLR